MMSIERVVELVVMMTDEEVRSMAHVLERRGRSLLEVLWEGSPEEAVERGRHRGGSDRLRSFACLSPECAYRYALDVDKGPHDETRQAASREPLHALNYALDVDKGAHDVTRKGASGDYYYAFCYADDVDGGAHPETWEAVKDTCCAHGYRQICNVNEEEAWWWE